METIIFDSVRELKKDKDMLERKLKVNITITGRKVVFDGTALDEYEASSVLEAINFGFSAGTALLLKDPDIVFKKVNIKKFTRRKNLRDVRARVIGTYGQTKNTLEDITGCHLIVKDDRNSVGVIGFADAVDRAVTALANLIRGSKQANVYKYLETINRKKKLRKDDGLGLVKENDEK